MLRCIVVLIAGLAASPSFAQTTPLRVFLRGGPKTHGPGEHEHALFVDDWTKLLTERGAKVEGSLEFPSAEQLARTDVLVMYAAEGGSIHGEDRAHLEQYLARGGGIVALHDAVCGDDPQWFKTVIGGAWEHGHAKYSTGTIDLYVADREHPITAGAENFRFDDEIYFDLHMQPEAHVLMNGFHTVFDITPQMWTYEKAGYRAFVSIQGHYRESFSHPAWRTLLLRGIAWAGKRDVESLLIGGEAAALAYPPGGPTRPEEASKLIDVHPDFDMSLVAAEPLIVKPIAIDWDPRGRMWVAMTPGYPEKERFSGVPAHDEIAILGDANGDGRMDWRKTFFKGLDLVTTFVFHRDGVIVGQSPDILFLRDVDGDDVCDKKEVLFTGFGFADTHAVMSSFHWGPDGWIYATQGYSGNASTHITNAAGRDFGKIGNGLFRFRPDGSAIEMVSSYGSNTWGCDFSSDGELFFSMANGAHLRHVVVPERFLEGNRVDNVTSWADCPDHDRVVPAIVHNDAPYAQIDFVGGFTAASGCTLYKGGAWPSEWNDTVFVCEPTVHIVHHDVLEAKGVTFVAHKAREQEFIAGRDLWFRPIDTRVGPDGALYVLDFYNQAVVHNDTRGPKHGPTNFAIRPDRDHDHGRIWRVQHKSAKPVVLTLPLSPSLEAEVALLDHPNAWGRNTAERLLVEQNDARAPELLKRFIQATNQDFDRVQSAWTLERLGAFDTETSGWMTKEGFNVHSRATLARIAVELVQRGVEVPNADQIAQGVLAKSPRVSLLTLCATSELGPDCARQLDWFLADNALADPWTRSLAARVASRDVPAFVSHMIQRRGRSSDVATLAAQATRVAVRRDGWKAVRPILDVVAGPGPVDLRASVVGALAETNPVGVAEPGTADNLARILADDDERLSLAGLPLVSRWKLDAQLAPQVSKLGERLQEQLLDVSRAPESRIEALPALLSIAERRPAAIEASRGLLELDGNPATQLAVLAALGTTDDPQAASVIAGSYLSLTSSARDAAFELLAARARWADALLDDVNSESITAADLGPQKIHRLRNHPDAAVSQRATKLFETLAGASNAKIEELVAKLLPEVDQPGDRVHGHEVFKQNCATCHTAFGEGAKVGPDISGMGAHGARDLLPIILDPNRTVEAAYAEWIVTTKDERNFAGVLVRDSNDSVVLRSSSGDAEVARADIDTMKNTGRSPMPAGLESLGAPALRDLIAYLAGDFAGYRVLDLKKVVSSNSLAGLYDTKRDDKPMKFARYGVVEHEGVPFELLDPRRTDSGCNALVLKGGLVADWESKLHKPQRVEVRVGCEVARVHVLGGIGGWAFPYIKDVKPVVKWTWRFADGTSEEVELKNGVEFGDWIGRNDVPGSQFADGLLADDSWGQVRRFSVEPHAKKVVDAIVLESYDNEIAPTLIALTAELPGAKQHEAKAIEPLDVLVFGGGSSHDFERWFRDADLATLKSAGIASASFTSSPSDATRQLEKLKALVVCTNQPMPAEFHRALFDFTARGGGLLVYHPSNWFNWTDWSEYNAQLVGGGARGHEKLQEFEVRVVDAQHEIMRNVPSTFRVTDELYRFEHAATDAEIHVLAIGRSLETNAEFPVVWTVARKSGRTVCITLGHDGGAHELPAFKALLTNAVRWLTAERR